MRPFDKDEWTGVTEYFDKIDGKVIIKRTQDVENTLDHNQIDRIDNTGWKGDMHKVASVPVIVADMWREELKKQGCSNPNPFCNENRPFLIAKLNNGDWYKLRTKDGTL